MDINLRRPAYQAIDAQLLAVQESASPTMPVNVINEATAHLVHNPIPRRILKPIDFEQNARQFKRRLLAERWARRFSFTIYGLLSLAVILAVIGFYVDHIYRGRALPYSYVGPVSVGGLTKSQIETTLKQQESQMTISFVDGGLTTSVPVSKLGIDYNIQLLADQITHHSFNPFFYLSVHHFLASPNFTNNALAQFLNKYVNNTKTAPENAVIIKTKTGLAIKPELQGFQANAGYLSKAILSQSADLSSPIINVNVVSTNPVIYSADLTNQLSYGNSLLKNVVSIKYRNTIITPSIQDKLAWLAISQVPGTTTDSLTFTPALVRSYVLTQANKFQQHISPTSAQLSGQTVSTYQGSVINNIDDVTNQIVQAMNNDTPVSATFTTSEHTYNTLTPLSK